MGVAGQPKPTRVRMHEGLKPLEWGRSTGAGSTGAEPYFSPSIKAVIDRSQSALA
jgi:hypothetical protein